MHGSFNFLLHLIGFGMITTSLLAGWLVERRIRRESDWGIKLAFIQTNRTLGLLTPVASVLMLVTGIVNIFNLFPADPSLWFAQGWLVAKIILFAFLLTNGAVFGPIISRKRTKLIRELREGSAPPESEETVRIFSKNLTTFYMVQSLLLLVILFLSAFGDGKHPGAF